MRDMPPHSASGGGGQPDGGEGGRQGGSALWADALLAMRLFAVDPPAIGGIVLKAQPGPVRDLWLQSLREVLSPGTPWCKVPLHVGESQLLGGLDLALTLKAGRPVAARGLLAGAHGGVIVLAMAERVQATVAAQIAAALDAGMVTAERDGFALRMPARFGIIALDEGVGDDGPVAGVLRERLAFEIDLNGIAPRDAVLPALPHDDLAAALRRLSAIPASSDVVEALCAAAAALGVGSLRAPLLALNVARAAAALAGGNSIEDTHAALAARLVLAHRATVIPAPDEARDDNVEETADDHQENAQDQDGSGDGDGDGALDDVILQAALAAVPPELLAQLQMGETRIRSAGGSRAGAVRKNRNRGRPIGARRGELRSGARLNVIETLRAAAPWQPLRRHHMPGRQRSTPAHLVEVRPDDFRITRFKQRSQTVTIFDVDASGSQAFARLAEVKGAVELLLAETYVRRDEVALIAFRGQKAELLLPPTRSLTRAKRSLAAMPGGGGTPLAAGIEAAALLADSLKRKGQTPIIVLLTDGKANITRPSAGNRLTAAEDALAAARALRACGVNSIFIDTSQRPRPEAKRLAAEMGARYVPLPYADAAALNATLKTIR